MSDSARTTPSAIAAVVFDLDGVLIESEGAWSVIREELTAERGGNWHAGAHEDMMGMSSTEWSVYMRDELGVDREPEEISDEVVSRLSELYARDLPVLPGAVEAVEGLAQRWPLAVASSSNRPLIERVLELLGVAAAFSAIVSSEEVARGKPAPDVYLEAAARLGVDPSACAAVEDSSNGLRSARAAGMRVVAVPSASYPPAEDALAGAAVVLRDLSELTPEAIAA